MNLLKVLFCSIFLVVLLSNFTLASKDRIKLLAVSDAQEGELKGSIADLYLTIKPGSGGVYLDTYPLTRLDTQISTRFAKEFACKEMNYDCDKNDFFYTIKSGSTMVGGPSAGSAMTVLTIAVLENWNMNDNIAITGTINSGGLIGPVGGLKEKIDAASQNQITIILIPDGERFIDNKNDNTTLDLMQYAKELNITLIEVNDVRDAVYYFTGHKLEEPTGDVIINSEYAKTMKKVAGELCDRSTMLYQLILAKNKTNVYGLNESYLIPIINTTVKSDQYLKQGEYYTAASICFSANTKLNFYLLLQQNWTNEKIASRLKEEKARIKLIEQKIDNRDHLSVTDLETYMIVKERLDEAKDLLKQAEDNFVKSINTINNLSNQIFNETNYNKNISSLNQTNIVYNINNINYGQGIYSNNNSIQNFSENQLNDNEVKSIIYALGYSIERTSSAESWSNFFNLNSKTQKIDSISLKNSCMTKVAEAEERYQYVRLFIPDALEDTRKTLDRAYTQMNTDNFELCLFTASMAKAEADMVLGAFGIEESKINLTITKKLEAVRKNLIRQQAKGFFPLAGYSYYEYANSLQQTDKYSSLLYAEYSLELSNVDMYFKQEKKWYSISPKIEYGMVWTFFLGLSIGILVTIQLLKKNIKHKKKR